MMRDYMVTSMIWLVVLAAKGRSSPVSASGNGTRPPPTPGLPPNRLFRSDDFDEFHKLGLSSDDLEQNVRILMDITRGSSGGHRPTNDMKRYFLANHSVVCNDGSVAGYYLKRSNESTRWLLYLEGGWFCFDQSSCHSRWLSTPYLMSSDQWPLTRKGTGILSWDPQENPFIHDGNLVYLPYCSSDSWTGTFKSRIRGERSFMGSVIIDEVVKELFRNHGMKSAKRVFLSGSSAGGTGVLLNLDRVSDNLRGLVESVGGKASDMDVRGIADSGWFLDNKQFRETGDHCHDIQSCSPSQSAQKGLQLWRGVVPESCRRRFPSEVWRCYFGYRIYPSIQTPVYIIQHLFDEAQLFAGNVGPPVSKEQWRYIHYLGLEVKNTLANVSSVFASACLSHVTLVRSDWHHVKIHEVNLPAALRCWEEGSQESNHYTKIRHHQRRFYNQMTHKLITGGSTTSRQKEDVLADDSSVTVGDKQPTKSKLANKVRKRQHKKMNDEAVRGGDKSKKHLQSKLEKPQKKSKKHKSHRKQRQQQSNFQQPLIELITKVDAVQRHPIIPSSSPRMKRRVASSSSRSRSDLSFNEHDFHRLIVHENSCSHHLIDHCDFPQCNTSCPKMRNPFTGDEMDFGMLRDLTTQDEVSRRASGNRKQRTVLQ